MSGAVLRTTSVCLPAAGVGIKSMLAVTRFNCWIIVDLHYFRLRTICIARYGNRKKISTQLFTNAMPQ
jgi:hypothetical protein